MPQTPSHSNEFILVQYLAYTILNVGLEMLVGLVHLCIMLLNIRGLSKRKGYLCFIRANTWEVHQFVLLVWANVIILNPH